MAPSVHGVSGILERVIRFAELTIFEVLSEDECDTCHDSLRCRTRVRARCPGEPSAHARELSGHESLVVVTPDPGAQHEQTRQCSTTRNDGEREPHTPHRTLDRRVCVG